VRSLAILVLLAGVATASPEQDFQAAAARAATGDPAGIAALEALGAAEPRSRWSDDAWVEAARYAERAGDRDRARRDLERAIAIGDDPQLVRRARNDLARLSAITGDAGEWTAVAAEHDRLIDQLAHGDPVPALRALEDLLRAHPGYPRGDAVRLALARGWEGEDEVARAAGLLRGRDALRVALVRLLIRARDLAEARGELARVADANARRALATELTVAERRAWIRRGLAVLLLVLVGAAVALVRRDAGSWRAAGRALARPSTEALYLAPIGSVVALVAATGNPLVARAVWMIVIGGVVLAWFSGGALEAARRAGRLRRVRALAHAAGVIAAVLAMAYLAIDHARLLDLVAETWRAGPE